MREGDLISNLLKTRATATEDAKRLKAKEKVKKTVSYSIDGKAVKEKLTKKKKIMLTSGMVICALGLLIYVPPFFYSDEDSNSSYTIEPDVSAIKTYQTYLKDHPDADFDNDGLSNSLETENGTDIWNNDSDNDGITDYAELYVTETSPVNANNSLVEKTKSDDEEAGNSLSTPYKIDDIIFWPDSYSYKAFGTVVRTLDGYRFCYYKGWVRFPQKVYAYKYKDGVHIPLTYRENEDAYYIDSSDEIRIYSEELEFVHCLKLPFIDNIYLTDNVFSRALTKMLPSKGGILTCYKTATIDTEPETEDNVTATLRSPLINRDDTTRLGQNMNTLKDLSWVRKLIEADHCVAVSLYSSNAGESIGIVYGYTKEGNLLVADESLNPVGVLKITEKAVKRMDKDGNVSQDSWFEFKGLGFDSAKNKDRISFFASTITEASSDISGVAPSAVDAAATESESTESEVYHDTVETDDEETTVEPTVTPTETPTETPASVATFGF